MAPLRARIRIRISIRIRIRISIRIRLRLVQARIRVQEAERDADRDRCRSGSGTGQEIADSRVPSSACDDVNGRCVPEGCPAPRRRGLATLQVDPMLDVRAPEDLLRAAKSASPIDGTK